jgi:hypothetical protein
MEARTSAGTPSSASDDAYPQGDPLNTVAGLEFTNVGVRVNLTNDVPVKGLQLYLRLKRPIAPPSGDVKFRRAAAMNVFVAGSTHEVIAVAFNFSNTPIDTGSGPVIRLPIAGLDTSDVDSVAIIVSTGDANKSTMLAGQQLALGIVEYPTTYVLRQNYPNPFNSQTTIEYDVPELVGRVARVSIQIFNILGEKVTTIERGDKDAGSYRVTWHGRDEYGNILSTGVYFYRLLSLDPANENHFTSSKKMIYLK